METNNNLLVLSGALTKSEQGTVAENFVSAVLDGEIDVMEAFARAKAMSETLNAILKDKRFVDAVVSECDKFGKETPDWRGVKFAVSEVGVKYDFSVCNDSTWNQLTETIDELTAERKQREEFLKTLRADMNIADANTGEILDPPARTSTTSVRVTFKK